VAVIGVELAAQAADEDDRIAVALEILFVSFSVGSVLKRPGPRSIQVFEQPVLECRQFDRFCDRPERACRA
jgi:hypothetical protein